MTAWNEHIVQVTVSFDVHVEVEEDADPLPHAKGKIEHLLRALDDVCDVIGDMSGPRKITGARILELER
jgi:hypothetical protein